METAPISGGKPGRRTDRFSPLEGLYCAHRDKGGHRMNPYIIPVGFLNTLVSFFLLLAADRVTQRGSTVLRIFLASLWGGVYGGICMVSGLTFLGNTLWRLMSMAITAAVAWYGCGGAVLAGMLYGILQLAMTGLAAGLNSWVGALFLALAVCILWLYGWHGSGGEAIPVELFFQDRTIRLTALRDTGNTLADPVTGKPVLVVGADVGQKILGLSQAQLRKPVDCIRDHPDAGLRLIPYRAVGKEGGMLLAAKMDKVMINGVSSGKLVAFAPEIIGRGEQYQALTGG